MNLNEIKEKAIDSELVTITSGTIEAKTGTYTQHCNSNKESLECVINAYYFQHPEHTSAISQLPDHVSVTYGKGENTFYYRLITRKHLKGKRKQLIAGDAELTKEAVSNGLYVNSDYGKKGEKDARESAEKIRDFSRKHPEVEVCYSHDL